MSHYVHLTTRMKNVTNCDSTDSDRLIALQSVKIFLSLAMRNLCVLSAAHPHVPLAVYLSNSPTSKAPRTYSFEHRRQVEFVVEAGRGPERQEYFREHRRQSAHLALPSSRKLDRLGRLPMQEVLHPQPSFLKAEADTTSYDPSVNVSPSPDTSTPILPTLSSVPGTAPSDAYGARSSVRRKRLIGLGVLAALIVVVLVVVLPIYFVIIKKHHDAPSAPASSGTATASSGGDGTGQTSPVGILTGGDGSTVVTASGESFTYKNPFGGYWISDPQNPFASGARANNWTPPLNESWTWGVDRVYGVNLGGWFVLEPFIAPALFQPYPSAGDEWDLATLMRADGTLEAKMEAHYDTFITEQDIAQIAGAGLNWVRVPIPFWAVSSWSDTGTDDNGNVVGEPFLDGVCWKYIIRLFGWARKYGIRVNLDLHTVPGSQNGFNHSGKRGQINFLNGIMGIANAQRILDYIRIIAEFISQPEYRDVVQIFSVVNEPLLGAIGRPQINSFYLHVHDMLRNITGYGAGNGPYIGFHDGFGGVASWGGFLTGADRIVLDTHPYFAFSGKPNDDPIATGEDPQSAGGPWPAAACDGWGSLLNTSRSEFGVTVAGEFSNGYNDCGLYLNGVNGTAHYGGDCAQWEDSSAWNPSVKAGLMQFALASMDALGDWFFWTWKIGNATDGVVRSPLWSYQLGLEGGWMPTDPRTANGKCGSLGIKGSKFDGTFSAWQTGGAGAGTIHAAATNDIGTWPPATISNVDAGAMTLLPTYTATGSVPTLTYITPTITASGATMTPTVSIGNGWFDAEDTALGVTAVAGCTYPDAWGALDLPAPSALCTGA
ncbi:glycoside hydrolase superfamily [Mycena capillaripes]|nr:glycoside hydrolase superfamily [Mycena capillaripes]